MSAKVAWLLHVGTNAASAKAFAHVDKGAFFLSQARRFWHSYHMNMTAEAGIPVGSSDAKLVENSLRGDRDAFSQIVARYQSLVCSLAYSSTGSLTQSEDLAQETFAAAWKQLSGLREPEKLADTLG